MHFVSNLVHLVVNLFRKHAEDDGIGSILFFLWMCQTRLSYDLHAWSAQRHIEAILPHVACSPVHVHFDAYAVPETWRRILRGAHVDPIVTRRLAHLLARRARPHPAWLLFFWSCSPGFFAPWCSSVVSFWTLDCIVNYVGSPCTGLCVQAFLQGMHLQFMQLWFIL